MNVRTGITTMLCTCAGIGMMTSPIWFSNWVHPAGAGSTQSASHNDPCKNGYYALTFDDGPYPGHTENLVAMLKKLHLHATFFNVGKRAKRYPKLVALQRTVGEVENHSWNHKNYIHFNSKAAIKRNISKAERVLGRKSIYMRPPYGGTNETVRSAIGELGLVEAMWTVDTDDWSAPHTHRKLIHRALEVKRGGIILFHDGWPYVIYTLPEIIDRLQQRQMCSGKLETTAHLSSVMPGRKKDTYHTYPFRVQAGKP